MRSMPLSEFLDLYKIDPVRLSLYSPIEDREEILVALLQIIHAAKKWDRSLFPQGIKVKNVSLNFDARGEIETATITADTESTTQRVIGNQPVLPSLNNILTSFINSLALEKQQTSHWLRKFLLKDNATAQERRITAAYLQLTLVHFLWQQSQRKTENAKQQFSASLAKEHFPITTKSGAECLHKLMQMPGVTPCTFGKAWIDIIATMEKYWESGNLAQKKAAAQCIEFLDDLLMIPVVYTKHAWENAQTTLQEMLAAPKPAQSNNSSGLFGGAAAPDGGDVTQPQHHPATESTAATPC